MSSDVTRLLRDFVSLQRGTTYKGALVGLPGPVLLGLASIEPNGGFRYGGFKTYGGECPEKISLRPGDLYVSLKDVTQSGDLLGAVSRIPSDIPSGRLTQDTVKLVFDGEPVSRDYIYWLLRTPAYRDYCRGCATGTTTLGLARDDFLDYPVPIPSAADRLLVELLEGIEKRITLLRETNTTLEAIAQSLFKSWFVDFDPVRAKAEGRQPEDMDAATAALFPNSFEESELGLVPKGWAVACIGKVADVIDCLHAKKPELVDTGYPFLQLNSIRDDGLLDVSRVSFVTLGDYQKWTSRIEVKCGDCVITNVGRVGAVSQIPSGFTAAMGRNMTAIRLRDEWPFPTYLIELLQSSFMRAEIVSKTDEGTILSALNVKSIPHLRCILPSVEIMISFELIARPLRASMEENAARIQTLTQLRDTLLPRLISGQLGLPEAEALLTEAQV